MELEDKMMAMEFAFMALAKALHEARALPLGTLHSHLEMASLQLAESAELAPVARQLDALRAGIRQLG